MGIGCVVKVSYLWFYSVLLIDGVLLNLGYLN